MSDDGTNTNTWKSKVTGGGCGIPQGALVRDKSNKLRYDLIPTEVLDSLATVFTRGAKIHGDRNWEDIPYSYGDRFASAERHAWSWWKGIDLDPDGTDLNQAEQALWNWALLVTYIRRGIGKDNRPKRTSE